MKWRLLVFVCLCIILTGCIGDKKSLHHVDIDSVNTIYIQNNHENINVTTIDDAQLEGTFNKKVEIEQRDDELIMTFKEPWFKIGLNLSRKIEIKIPVSYQGDVVIDGSSGNVKIDDFVAKNLEVRAKSGKVNANFTTLQSNVNIETKSGNVKLQFGEKEPNLMLTASVGSGKQNISLPLHLSKLDQEKTLQGTSGDGTFDVEINTKSGNQEVK